MVYQRKKRTHEPEPQQFPQVQPSLFASPDLETPDAVAGPTAAPSWDTLQRQIDNPSYDFGKISILPPDSAVQRQPVNPSTLSKQEKFSQRFLSVQREPVVSSMSGAIGPMNHHFAAPREDGQAVPLAHTIAIQRQAKTADQETGAIAQSGAVNLMPKGSGRPLPKQVSDSFVQSGYPEVQQARVHVDDAATQSIQAKAYTQNNNIVVQSNGASEPKLLGHEATHVVQQSQMALKPDVNGTPINANPALEQNADDNGERVARNEPVRVKGVKAATQAADSINNSMVNQPVQQQADGIIQRWIDGKPKGNKDPVAAKQFLVKKNNIAEEIADQIVDVSRKSKSRVTYADMLQVARIMQKNKVAADKALTDFLNLSANVTANPNNANLDSLSAREKAKFKLAPERPLPRDPFKYSRSGAQDINFPAVAPMPAPPMPDASISVAPMPAPPMPDASIPVAPMPAPPMPDASIPVAPIPDSNAPIPPLSVLSQILNKKQVKSYWDLPENFGRKSKRDLLNKQRTKQEIEDRGADLGFKKNFSDISIGVEAELAGFVCALPKNASRKFGYIKSLKHEANVVSEPLVLLTKDMDKGAYTNPAKIPYVLPNDEWRSHTLELVTLPSLKKDMQRIQLVNDAISFAMNHFKERLATHNHQPLESADSPDKRFRIVPTVDLHVIATGEGNVSDSQHVSLSMPDKDKQATVGVKAKDFGTGKNKDLKMLQFEASPWFRPDFQDDLDENKLANIANKAGAKTVYAYLKSVIDFTCKMAIKYNLSIGSYQSPGDQKAQGITDPTVKNEWQLIPKTKPSMMLDGNVLDSADKEKVRSLINDSGSNDYDQNLWDAVTDYILGGGEVSGHNVNDATTGGDTSLLFEFRDIGRVSEYAPSYNPAAAGIKRSNQAAPVFVDPFATLTKKQQQAANLEVKKYVRDDRTNRIAFGKWFRKQPGKEKFSKKKSASKLASFAQLKQWLSEEKPKVLETILKKYIEDKESQAKPKNKKSQKATSTYDQPWDWNMEDKPKPVGRDREKGKGKIVEVWRGNDGKVGGRIEFDGEKEIHFHQNDFQDEYDAMDAKVGADVIFNYNTYNQRYWMDDYKPNLRVIKIRKSAFNY